MERLKKTRKILFAVVVCFCFVFMIPACSNHPQEISDSMLHGSEAQIKAEEWRQMDAERIALVVHKTYNEAVQTDSLDCLKTMQTIIGRLGEGGYTAVDSENQVDMTNADQVLAFCDAVDAKENAELTIVEVMGINATSENGFYKYDFWTENSSVDITREYYCFDGYGNLVKENTVSYPADL